MVADGIDNVTRPDRRARPPRVHTSLVGRDEELAHLTGLIRSFDAPVITITGRSGSGKTRLAMEAAHRAGPDLPGGAVLIALDAVADLSVLPSAVAAALDLSIATGQEPEGAIKRELQFAPTLLVVDDIDEIPGAAKWFARLIEDVPGSKMVATAKGPLRTAAERIVRVGALSGANESRISDDELMRMPAVVLFADRASAVQYNFKLDRSNVRQIAELCRRLDGLPLAIELAAARSTTLSPGAQLRLIERGSALEMGRQRGGLRDAIALTYGLMSEAEQHLLRGIAVFEGAPGLEAVRAVCAPDTSEAELVDRLSTLVDFNLVEADNTNDDPHYRLLPMIREFALEQALSGDERPTNLARQNDYYVAFARSADDLSEHLQIRATARERTNLETVLGRLVAAGDTVRAARLAADLGWLWESRGWFPTAQAWLNDLIVAGESEAATDPETRALALIWWVRLSLQHPDAVKRAELIAERQVLGLSLARQSGNSDTILLALSAIYFSVLITHDFASAVAATQEGLALATATGDEQWIARWEVSAGVAANRAGDFETAMRLARSALARARRNDDRAGLLPPVLMLNEARLLGHDVPDELPSHEDLLALTLDLGDLRGQGWVLSGLASRSLRLGDTAASLRWTIEGLELGRRTGLWDSAGFACMHLVLIASARNDDAAIARLHGSLASVMLEVSMSMSTAYMANYREIIGKARDRFGSASFDRLAEAAGQLSWDEVTLVALDYARRLQGTLAAEEGESAPALEPVVTPSPPDPVGSRLTRREREVLALLATGASNADIATKLGLSAKTAMHHSMNIYAKLGVRGRAEATAWAFRNGVASSTS